MIGRIGWTCRDVWWAATQDPRAWAALPRAGYEPDYSETLGLDELEALYAGAPEEVADEAALHRAGAGKASRRRVPDSESPRGICTPAPKTG